MKNARFHPTLILAVLGGLACSGEEGLITADDDGQTIATLSGTLDATSAPDISGSIYFAILWMPEASLAAIFDAPDLYDGFQSNCTWTSGFGLGSKLTLTETIVSDWIPEPVEFQPEFPLDFSIPLRRVPPEASRIDLGGMLDGGEGEMAMGLLIAYEDSDGDGVLDLPSPGEDGDHLLAISSDQIIMYLDGTVNTDAGFFSNVTDGEFEPGLNVMTYDNTTRTFETRASPDSLKMTFLPNDPALRAGSVSLTCSVLERRHVYGGPRPERVDSATCNEFRDYVWRVTEQDPGEPCVIVVTRGRECLTPTQSEPANWPCP
ncbi:MAG: hypothetical protein AAFZ18_11715 [Myxococcota bacterium]